MCSAEPPRSGAEFFLTPAGGNQRRYEALRAYFVDRATAADAAAKVGLAEGTVAAMVRDFRAGDRDFFAARRPGPRRAPAKDAARVEVLRLRAGGHSVTEIAEALATGPTPLNRTGVWEVLRDEGHERLVPRAASDRGAPRRDHPPRTRTLAWRTRRSG